MSNLSPRAEEVLLEFDVDTWTMEFPKYRNDPGIKELEEFQLIAFHPGGPFGSRCSFYRTKAGVVVWNELKEKSS